MNHTEMTRAIEELTGRITALEAQAAEAAKPRDRGPKSEQTMTEEHAFRVKFGDLKDTKHKDAADALKLSYGQIFSCRGGYTFKQVKADWRKPVVTETPPPAEGPKAGETTPEGAAQ